MTNQAAQTMPERAYMTRDEALKIARACAYAKCHTHDYLPRTAQEAADWQPHEWALDAIRWNALSQTAGVVEGWKLVPVEPTEAMCEAAMSSLGWSRSQAAATAAPITPASPMMEGAMKVWSAMLAAAPAASVVHPDALPDGTLSKSTAKRVDAQRLAQGEDSVYSPVSPEEEAAIDEACGLVKVVLRLPVHHMEVIDERAKGIGVVRQLVLQDIIERAVTTPPTPQRQQNAVDDLIEAVANACMRSSKRHGAAGYQDDMNRLYAAVYRLKPEGIDGPLADRVPDSLEAALSRLPRGAK